MLNSVFKQTHVERQEICIELNCIKTVSLDLSFSRSFLLNLLCVIFVELEHCGAKLKANKNASLCFMHAHIHLFHTTSLIICCTVS